MNYIGKELLELNKLLKRIGNQPESDQDRARDMVQFVIDRIKEGKQMDRTELQSCFKIDILDLFCYVNGVTRDDIFSKCRKPGVVDTRQMFIYFNRNIRSEMIADYLGIHRTTVVYHKEKVVDNMQFDKHFCERYKMALDQYTI